MERPPITLNKLYPMRMFAWGTLRQGLDRHGEFRKAGAVRLDSNALIKGYYLIPGYSTGLFGVELVRHETDPAFQATGELYAISHGCLTWCDRVFTTKMVDRVIVEVSYWDYELKPQKEAAWTYVYTGQPQAGKKAASIFELTQQGG